MVSVRSASEAIRQGAREQRKALVRKTAVLAARVAAKGELVAELSAS